MWNQWTQFAISYASAGEVLIQARGGDVRVYGRMQKARDKKSDKTAEAGSGIVIVISTALRWAPPPEPKILNLITVNSFAPARKCAGRLVLLPSSNLAVVPAEAPPARPLPAP